MSAGPLAGLVRDRMRVAVGDGLGYPRWAMADLCHAASDHTDVSLFLGWMPMLSEGLDLTVFSDVRTIMPAGALRTPVEAGLIRAVPSRLSGVPALLQGPLRPDLLLVTVVPAPGGYLLGCEVSWMRGLIEAGVPVAAIVSHGSPRCDTGGVIPAERVTVLGETDEGPLELADIEPTQVHEALAKHIAELVPDGARLQMGPGQLGTAVVRAIPRPVAIDSGLLSESVVDLEERGLLVGSPTAAYLAGGRRLFEWADGRPILHPVEYTHDLGRLAADPPLIAVNTALEIDVHGQVNVEGNAEVLIGGIGGHPDFAAGGSRSIRGLSVVGLPSTHRGLSTLVERLSRPVSTAAYDVDVIVTENGAADLRGLDQGERSSRLRDLWAEVRR